MRTVLGNGLIEVIVATVLIVVEYRIQNTENTEYLNFLLSTPPLSRRAGPAEKWDLGGRAGQLAKWPASWPSGRPLGQVVILAGGPEHIYIFYTTGLCDFCEEAKLRYPMLMGRVI